MSANRNVCVEITFFLIKPSTGEEKELTICALFDDYEQNEFYQESWYADLENDLNIPNGFEISEKEPEASYVDYPMLPVLDYRSGENFHSQ